MTLSTGPILDTTRLLCILYLDRSSSSQISKTNGYCAIRGGPDRPVEMSTAGMEEKEKHLP